MAWSDEARAAALAARRAKAKHPAKGAEKTLRINRPMTVMTNSGKVTKVIGRRGANLIKTSGGTIKLSSVAKVQSAHLRSTKNGIGMVRTWKSVK